MRSRYPRLAVLGLLLAMGLPACGAPEERPPCAWTAALPSIREGRPGGGGPYRLENVSAEISDASPAPGSHRTLRVRVEADVRASVEFDTGGEGEGGGARGGVLLVLVQDVPRELFVDLDEAWHRHDYRAEPSTAWTFAGIDCTVPTVDVEAPSVAAAPFRVAFLFRHAGGQLPPRLRFSAELPFHVRYGKPIAAPFFEDTYAEAALAAPVVFLGAHGSGGGGGLGPAACRALDAQRRNRIALRYPVGNASHKAVVGAVTFLVTTAAALLVLVALLRAPRTREGAAPRPDKAE